jgi:predicted MFS family arabinose efflux permease
MISALITLLGGWLRMLAMVNDNFWWVVAGCTVVGAAAPFQMGGLSLIANYWFGDNERGKATSIMTISNPLGMLIGFAMQGIFAARMAVQEKVITPGPAVQ